MLRYKPEFASWPPPPSYKFLKAPGSAALVSLELLTVASEKGRAFAWHSGQGTRRGTDQKGMSFVCG